MTVRPLLLRIHRWAGLSIGLLAAVVVATGTIAVIGPDLERWIGQREEAQSGRGPLTIGMAAVHTTYPQAELDRIITANAPGRGDAIRVKLPQPSGAISATDMKDNEAYDSHRFVVFTDPVDGRILGDTRDSTTLAVMDFFVTFHAELFLPGLLKDLVLGSTALALLIFAVTGFVLWWPGWRKLRSGFRLRLTKTPFLRHFDLHRVAAITTVPILLVTAVTGLFFTWNWTRSLTYYGLGGGDSLPHQLLPKDEKQRLSYGTSNGEPLALDTLITSAATAAGLDPATASVLRINGLRELAARPGHRKVIRVWFDHPGNFDHDSGAISVRIDPVTAEAVHIDDPRGGSPGRWLLANQWALHTGWFGSSGSWWGLFARVVWIVAGIAITSLGVTGVGVWYHRRQQQRAAAAKKAQLANKKSTALTKLVTITPTSPTILDPSTP